MLKIAVIDDQEKYLLNWKLCLEKEAHVLLFWHHKECFSYFKENPREVEELAYIISDRFVPDYDALKDNFAMEFQTKHPSFSGKILLSSSAHKAYEDIGRGFTISIGKQTKELNELLAMIKNL